MSTNKGSAKAPKERQAASEYAISAQFGEHKSALVKLFKQLGAAKSTEDKATNTRQEASMAIAGHAFAVGNECEAAKIDRVTAAKGYVAEIKALGPQLLKAKWPYVETKENKDGTTGYKFTGYGNNILSWTRGVIEFNIDPATCVPAEGEAPQFGLVRDAVQAARKQDATPEVKEMARAREALSETIKEFRKVVMIGQDFLHVETCTTSLKKLTQDIRDQLAAQAELDEKAKTAEAEAMAQAMEDAGELVEGDEEEEQAEAA